MGQKNIKRLKKAFTRNGELYTDFKKIKRRYNALPSKEKGEFIQNTVALITQIDEYTRSKTESEPNVTDTNTEQ